LQKKSTAESAESAEVLDVLAKPHLNRIFNLEFRAYPQRKVLDILGVLGPLGGDQASLRLRCDLPHLIIWPLT
jgi:hypothetical protein